MKLKRFKLLLIALCTLCGGGNSALAQTDVTSTYFTDATFDSETAATSDVSTTKAGNYASMSNWTVVGSKTDNSKDAYSCSAIFSYGSSVKLNSVTPPSSGPNSETTGKALGISMGWVGVVTITQASKAVLPSGDYTLSYYTYNKNSSATRTKLEVGFVESDNTEHTATISSITYGSWIKQTISFTLESNTSGTFRIIAKSNQNASSNNEAKFFLDGIKLEYKNIHGSTLAALIANAQRVNALLDDDDLAAAISSANDDYEGINDTPEYQATIDDAISALSSAITTAYSNATLNHEDDLTAIISNANFETSPIFDGTSLGASGTTNATPTDGSTLLTNAINAYEIPGWDSMNTETSDYVRTFTMPFEKTLYVRSNNAVGGQAVTSPTNGSSVTKSNSSLLFMETSWCNNAINGVKQTVTLPVGVYKMTFDSYVSSSLSNANSRCGVSYGNTTNYKWPETLETWTNNEIEFTLSEECEVTFSMGYKKTANVGSGTSAFLFVDNVKLIYLNPLKKAQLDWADAKAAAIAARDDDYYSNVTGDELDDLESAITTYADEPTSIEDCETAIEALNAAKETFTAAKSAYDRFDAELPNALALGVASGSIVRPTSADNLQDALNALIVLEDAAVTSGYTVNAEDLLGSWTKSASAETASGQHWSGDASVSYINKWSASTFTMSVSQTVTLPAGSYVFKAAARAKENGVNDLYMSVKVGSNAAVEENFVAKEGTGYGIATDGSANYTESADTYANSNNGYGWEWRFLGFTLAEETSVQLKVYADVKANGWASFSDYSLFSTADNIGYFETLYTNAKTAAETARDAAAYVNVDGAEKKALTDAIDEDVPDPATIKWYQDQKDALEEATADFTNATTVANYNRLAAAIAKAEDLSVDHDDYDATTSTTADDALTNANDLYTAMLNAQKTAKAQGDRVLGFESGEYAPYNNVDILVAWAKADAIETVADATTDALDEAIDALNDASWSSANASEVNAIYDGDFNIQPEHTSTPTVLKGWTAVEGIRQLIKNTETDPGLEYASQNAAIFTWGGTAITYGAENGYTLPMGKYVYKLSFKVAGWRDGDLPSSISATLKKDGVTKSSGNLNPQVTKRINVAEGNPFEEVQFYLLAPEAGNYTLEISTNKHTVYTDFNLIKATALTIADTDASVLKGFTNNVDVTVNRTLVADKWQGFSLPFDLSAEEIAASDLNGASIVKFKSSSDNVITFEAATAVEAGVPYLIKPAAGDNITSMTFTGKIIAADVEEQEMGDGDYKFKAQLYNTTLPTDGTIAYMSTNTQKVVKLTSGGIKGTRAYFIIPEGASEARIVIEGEEVTSIRGAEFIVQSPEKGVYYDLQGRKVTGKPSQRGIYVVNGKKVVVK